MNIRVCVLIYLSRSIMVGTTALIEIGIMSKQYMFHVSSFVCVCIFILFPSLVHVYSILGQYPVG
jgi:hypothetical protein